MAARTRSAIKTLVEANTGRTKDTLESSLCDTALKIALMQHHFKDAQSSPSDFTITEDATSVDISGISDLVNIVTARIVEASGSRNMILKLKTRTWWDLHIRNAEDNQKGWPIYAMKWGSTLLLDRPADSGLELRLRITTVQTFATDATVCPIAVLDIFVEDYVTGGVFANLENWTSSKHWMRKALGAQYELNGKIGGELANAIASDSIMDKALDVRAEPSGPSAERAGGISILNDIDGHDDQGNTRWWS